MLNPDAQSLAEWLSFLESLKTVRSTSNAFSSVRAVMDRLALWPRFEKIITVTGTNGKGSCVAALESIYLQANYRVGAFTSPHLLHFNERIRVQGEMVTDAEICEAFNAIDEARKNVALSYFHFSFLAALWLFKKAQLDLMILEVGIGGQSDVVNLIDADLAIITSIDLDHCEVLGNSRADIAREKAGIMRAYKPVICGDKNPPSVLSEVAEKLKASLFVVGKDFFYESAGKEWVFKSADDYFEHLPIPAIDLANAATALMGVMCLRPAFPVSFEAIKGGLENVFLPGRFQPIDYQRRTIIVDVAHNPAATRHFFDQVKCAYPERRVHTIFGMQKDKDIAGVLAAAIPFVNAWYLISLPKPRGVEAREIAVQFEKAGQSHYQVCINADEALEQVLHNTATADLIVVFGSFVTVAEVLKRV
ncbi:MAG: hypothetical protein A2103_02905 [Gammaproteobacteria bacterium GWF2_41_13]|nr:MAG: hypothetical protein A2103_02905 [Gammaproteobacteria bacterium GWF2_41_13]